MEPRLVAFIGVAALLTISPGPDMALVLRQALAHGRASVVPTALGIASGCLVWGAGSSLGVAALLAASAELYALLRLAGAAYLLALGSLALYAALRGHRETTEASGAARQLNRGSAYRVGLFSNLLNPKVGVFYATFLPQFIPPGQPAFATSMALAAIHAAMGVVWLVSYGIAASAFGDVLRTGRVRRAIEGVTGVVLMGFGLRIATDRG